MAIVNYEGSSVDVKNPHVLITNNRGDYLAVGCENHSNYDGYFVQRDQQIKILYNILPVEEITAVDVHDFVRRKTSSMKQELSLRKDSLVMNGEGRFLLTLDCKRLYDESDQGRIYSVEVLRGSTNLITVHYEKFSDAGLSHKSYEWYLAIATTLAIEEKKMWRQVRYAYDVRRGTGNTPWVFDLCFLQGNGTVSVAYGSTADQAKAYAVQGLREKMKLRVTPTLPVGSLLPWRSLAQLETPRGIMAGLPWFFQEWSRDELISCGGLLEAKDYNKVMIIVDKWYEVVRRDGTLPALYPDKGLASSDAPGWLGKRTRDLLVRLSEEDSIHQLQSKFPQWRDATAMMIDAAKTRFHDGFIWNEENTTWMDTKSNDDGRSGARIEIQALFLALYDTHAHLCTLTKTPIDKERAEFARQVLENVRQRLVVDGRLIDGLHADGRQDLTIRPNIFLAHYIAPNLFSKEEWKHFFEQALPALWLPWGGLASISTADGNFHANYTGEDVASYHRGDSWYFMNNMAAIAMSSVDPIAFKNQVQAIREASVRDMLEQGFCGHCSELSSAQAQEAFGCHAQAWSASTLLELLQHT